MDYAEAREAFFQPRESGATPGNAASPARALRDAIEPIAGVCFWSKHANDEYAAIGLDFLTGYVWGRASTLGEPAAGVVAAAFGVFEPSMIADVYAAGRKAANIEQIRRARERGSVAALRDVLGEPAELADTVAALRRGIDAGDTTSRPFFAGLGDLPWPDDPHGALWHATSMLREYRGDSHLAACTAAGLTGLEANLLTEIQVGWEKHSYTASRGWSAEAMDAATARLRERGLVTGEDTLTEDGARLRDGIEATTDALLQPVIDAIGPDLAAHTATLDGWATRIVEAGWFPPDPFKRASG